MTNIQLNFINNSNDVNNSDILIYQRNETNTLQQIVVAWMVIQNCGQGDNHPFTFPMELFLSASDSYGNYTPQHLAANSQRWAMNLTPSGDQLIFKDSNGPLNEIQVLNELQTGAINANIYRDGKLLAVKTNVVPGQLVDFSFKPTIYIGVATEVEQGQILNSAILSEINTEISLMGIKSADIVMTGGGGGSTSTPYSFNLQNIVFA